MLSEKGQERKKMQIKQNRLFLKESIKSIMNNKKFEQLNKKTRALDSWQIENFNLCSKSDQKSEIQEETALPPNRNTILFEEFYKLGEKIGMGTQSCVYKLLERDTHLVYAAKIFRKSDNQTINGALLVYDFMKNLDHQNIIRYEKKLMHQSKVYLITEYCAYSSLRNFIDSKRSQGSKDSSISQQKMAEIILKIARGLAYLKEQNICHRDIKPENILFDEVTGNLKIIDFEISRKRADDEISDLWSDCGSIYYRAPQSFGQGYDQRADMWSLGVLAYQMMTGTLPFYSQYKQTTKKKIKEAKISFPKHNFPHFLLNFIRLTLETDPELRITPLEAVQYLEMYTEKNEIEKKTVGTLSIDSIEEDIENIVQQSIPSFEQQQEVVRKRSRTF